MASLYLHALLLMSLALATFAAAEPEQDVLLLAFSPTESRLPELTEVESMPVQLDQFVEQPPSSLTELPLHRIVDISPVNPLGTGQPPLELGAYELESLAHVFDAANVLSNPLVSELGESATAEFFGTDIEGRRIVFVLDNSGSMQGGRLETVIAELQRCVESLGEDQLFYVIFHSDSLYPLFYPEPVDRFVAPTPENKRRLQRWLATVELCLGDSIEQAVAAAESVRPDTVFLLSDGKIPSQRKREYLLASGLRGFPIHTFGVGMGGNTIGRQALEGIAAANFGQFRHTEVPAEMRRLAQEKPRPYHRLTPGPIWGRNVAAR